MGPVRQLKACKPRNGLAQDKLDKKKLSRVEASYLAKDRDQLRELKVALSTTNDKEN